MNYLSFKKILFVLFIVLFLPKTSFSASLNLESNKTNIRENEEFVLSAVLDSSEKINAVEGTMVFDGNFLKVKEIRDGNSVVNFWVEKPSLVSDGKIHFSGITPGGFSGSKEVIFSVVFKTKNEQGNTKISFSDLDILKNDGLGTKIPVTLESANILIKEGDSKYRQDFLEDDTLPEYFVPVLTKKEDLFGGKYFLVFATQDKDSGISHYEIKEYRFKLLKSIKNWSIAESPYVIRDQSLKSFIIIKAIDNNGNERIQELAPTYPPVWYEYSLIWIIIIVVFGFILFILKKWKIGKKYHI